MLGAAAFGGQTTSTSFDALTRGERRALVFALQEQAGPQRADREERFDRELPEVKERVEALADLSRRIAAGRRFNPNPAELAAAITPSRLPRMDSGEPDPDRTRELLAGIPVEAAELSSELLP